MTDIVGKLWGFCHTLRHDGIDYGDYIEQLTYLLFLKMIEEKKAKIPAAYSWAVLREKSGTDLTDHYIDTLRELGKQKGRLGDIYAGAISRFANPVNLKRLVNLIDETEWTGLNVDVKAAAYEGLLEKSASEGKKGAGQYFTPRILIQSIVRCMKPEPRKSKDFTINDPAAGTGGFLVCAYEWLMEQTKGSLERDDAKRILTSGGWLGLGVGPRQCFALTIEESKNSRQNGLRTAFLASKRAFKDRSKRATGVGEKFWKRSLNSGMLRIGGSIKAGGQRSERQRSEDWRIWAGAGREAGTPAFAESQGLPVVEKCGVLGSVGESDIELRRVTPYPLEPRTLARGAPLWLREANAAGSPERQKGMVGNIKGRDGWRRGISSRSHRVIFSLRASRRRLLLRTFYIVVAPLPAKP